MLASEDIVFQKKILEDRIINRRLKAFVEKRLGGEIVLLIGIRLLSLLMGKLVFVMGYGLIILILHRELILIWM